LFAKVSVQRYFVDCAPPGMPRSPSSPNSRALRASLRCSCQGRAVKLPAFATLTPVKQPRRVSSRSALRAPPQALRSSAAKHGLAELRGIPGSSVCGCRALRTRGNPPSPERASNRGRIKFRTTALPEQAVSNEFALTPIAFSRQRVVQHEKSPARGTFNEAALDGNLGKRPWIPDQVRNDEINRPASLSPLLSIPRSTYPARLTPGSSNASTAGSAAHAPAGR